MIRTENPKNPPKKWWRDCVAGVEASGSAVDPESVCGSTWYHKMTDTQRREATRKSERRGNPTCLDEDTVREGLWSEIQDYLDAPVSSRKTSGVVYALREVGWTDADMSAYEREEGADQYLLKGARQFADFASIKQLSKAWGVCVQRKAGGRSGNPLPPGGADLIIGAAALAVGAFGLYAMYRVRQKKAAKKACTISVQKLDKWAIDKGYSVIYLYKVSTPPDGFFLKQQWPMLEEIPWDQIVAVTNDGAFWTYSDQAIPSRALDLEESYCKQ